MRPLPKRALRATAAAALLAATIYWSTLTGLDHTPYVRTAYYTATRARLDALATSPPAVTGPLEAGFGRASLTPVLGAGPPDSARGSFDTLPLAGYGNRDGRPATGIHDELWAKAVAVRVRDRRIVFVGADALIIPREVAEAASRALAADPGLRREELYFGATHTHAGPGGWGEGIVAEAFAGPYQPAVRDWMARQLTTAARAALADLAPAACGHGAFAAPAFVRNRLVGALGEVDTVFRYLALRQADGDQAVLGAYAAHATVLSADVMSFSGDYPGAWQRAVERGTGGLALFFAGAVGSHGPVAGAPGFDGATRMGEGLAAMLLEHLPRTPLTNRVRLGAVGLPVALPEPHVRLTDQRRLRPALARRLLPVGDHTWLQAVRLGDALWIATPCDFSGELALRLRPGFRERGLQTVVTSFNGDYIGYVIPARYYHLPGYESRTMSFFGPTVPDYFDELIRRLGILLADPPAGAEDARFDLGDAIRRDASLPGMPALCRGTPRDPQGGDGWPSAPGGSSGHRRGKGSSRRWSRAVAPSSYWTVPAASI
jgi:hypothetical protein